ncbi:hypothetical protein UA08_08575 [Talaromyces atroroseus]|uniref:Argonaute-binding protein 1 n=1 Tax=Talaromyces atroroseus TaxID=1441469 RepID=A0A1Q5Q7U0_TALAT|nr:hypothetical protein UA08_08575 [Talaromyces atroroseus]OKL56289.1 hypothetical protein UA08_08575 [Talaromyces atroroseus]
MESPENTAVSERTILDDDDDLSHHEADKEAQILSLEEEWAPPSSNSHTSDANQGSQELQSPKLTAKQKQKLERKAKYKKSSKSKSSGQPKPTGFEDFYCEPVLTPEGYNVERSIYDSDRPAIFRIQEALNRYQQKRRLLTERMQVFSQYLRYGGVDVCAKMFGGVSEQELKAMDKEGIITARSQTDISVDKMKLDVDFELVAKSFLSFYFPDYTSPASLEMIKMGTNTIRNWLNYLLYHEVLPEYADNIRAARKYCDLAEKQLWDNIRLLSVAPGDFNKASSVLFGGYYHGLPTTAQGEQPGAWGGEKFENMPMTADIAKKVVLFALACSGSDEQASRYVELSNAGQLSANPIRDIDGFEVIDILLPNAGVREFYNREAPDLNPVGKVRGKAWRNPSEPAIDLAPGETLPNIDKLEFEFFVEERLLQYIYLGMKIVTTVWELNCGIFFYDEIMTAYCSFYTTLLNDLMLGWKNPRELKRVKDDQGRDESVGEESALEKGE